MWLNISDKYSLEKLIDKEKKNDKIPYIMRPNPVCKYSIDNHLADSIYVS